MKNCQSCGGKNLKHLLELGHQPPSDAFLSKDALDKEVVHYPLDVYFCPDCFLVQLGYAVPPEILFKDYVYNSGTNNSLKVNFKELVDNIVRRFNLGQNTLAIDIGSNDGTLLINYLPHKVKILGVDPSSVAHMAIARGVPTVNDFFNEKVAAKIYKEYGRAFVITSTNTFAHVEDLDSLMRGVKKLLHKNGVFITESHYLLDLVEKMQYDSIYHEHLRYYSLLSLQKLLERYGMEIFDAERISTHGGSLRVYAGFKGHKIEKRVNQLLSLEKKKGLHRHETLKQFAGKVKKIRDDLLNLLLKLKNQDKKIVGIGAPAKGNTLLNYCRLDSRFINYLVEKSELKIGLFAPGSHIPVLSEKYFLEDQPDYGLILSWNIAGELMNKLKRAGYRGKFIIPNPKPRIIK